MRSSASRRSFTLTDAPTFAAIDLGASSGRVLAGRLADGKVALAELHRFANGPVQLPDGLRWDILHLLTEALAGLRRAGRLRGAGVDTWGVDYALLDERGRVLGLPYHYRDGRTDGMIERAFSRVPASELYAATGIQTLPINTIFQLLAEEGSPALSGARRIALVPDLLAYWLCGELANERTNASTTGLLDARRGEWALALIERLGIPTGPFGGLVEPGVELGAVRAEGLGDVAVFTVASHDTASAYAATPLSGEHAAVLSSGTWSLLGVELPAPVLTDAAREANLTNERGVDGTTRLLKNVMGLWLEQECARAWNASFPELHAAAFAAPADVPLFDPDREELLRPGDMPARIAAACGRPDMSRGEVVRSIFTSLACKYRTVLERLEEVTGRELRTVHVIGGGARNRLLCQLAADLTGREVLAGPVEATALGNVLVQARAAGELTSLADMRSVAAASSESLTYEPAIGREEADAVYRRFQDATGTGAPTAA
jgi:rhamnulokinase